MPLPIRAGQFNRQATIQTLTRTRDAAGRSGADVAGTFAVVWVEEKYPPKGSEPFADARDFSRKYRYFQTRWLDGVTPNMQLVLTDEGRIMDIKDSSDPDNRRKLLMLTCLEMRTVNTP